MSATPMTPEKYTILALDVPRQYVANLLSNVEHLEVGSGRTATVFDNGESVIKIFKDAFEFPDELVKCLANRDIDSALDFALENEIDDELLFGLLEIKNYLLIAEAKASSEIIPRIPELIATSIVTDTENGETYLALELGKVEGQRLGDKLDELQGAIRGIDITDEDRESVFEELKAVAMSTQDLAAALDFLSDHGLVDLDVNLTNILIDYDSLQGFYTMTKIDLGSVRPQTMWGAGIEYTGSARYLPWGSNSSQYLESLWFKDFHHKSAVTNAMHQHAFARIYYEILSGDNLFEPTGKIRLTFIKTILSQMGIKHPLLNRFNYFHHVLNAANFDLGLKFLNCRVLETLLYMGLVESDDLFDYMNSILEYVILIRLPYSHTKVWLNNRFDVIFKELNSKPKILKRICDILGIVEDENVNGVLDLLLRNEFGARVDDDESKPMGVDD